MFEKYWGDAEFKRLLVRLAIPIALQNLAITSFSLVDTLMVGKLGDIPLAAVGFASTWAQLMNYFIFGISSGATVFIARYWGAKNYKGIHHTYGIAMCGALIIGLAFSLISFFAPSRVMMIFTSDIHVIQAGSGYFRIIAFGYLGTSVNMIVGTVLRSTEQVRIPLLASVSGVLVNTLLNYILIFGKLGAPALGLNGAAIASLISIYVSLLVVLVASFTQKNIAISPIREMLDFDKAFLMRYIKISLPILINEIIWGGGQTTLMAIYGHMGTTGAAALTAIRTVEMVTRVAFIGLCSAAGIIVGKELGTNNIEKAKSYANNCVTWTLLLSVIASIVIMALRSPIISIFTLSDEAVIYSYKLMIVLAIEVLFRFFTFLMIVGIFRAGGDTMASLKFDASCLWGIGIVSAAFFGLVLQFSLPATYAIAALSQVVVKTTLCAVHYRSGKWIKQLEDV